MKFVEKLVPVLRFPGFIYELDLCNFSKVVEQNKYGPRFNANDYDLMGNVKTIRGTDISIDGEINYEQVPIAKLNENFILTHLLKDGDLVMITTADCGLTGVFREQKFQYICSAYAVKITINDAGEPFYFKYFFQTSLAKKEINKFVRKATVANLPGSDILSIKLKLPLIPEQKKIASFLSAEDKKIEKLTRKKELFEKYKKGVMQKIFSYELRFDKSSKGNDEIRRGRIKDFGFFYYGKSAPKWSIHPEAQIPCIRYGELYSTYKEKIDKVHSYTNISKEKLKFSKGGEVLIPRVGEDPLDFAMCSYLPFKNVAIGEMISVYNTTENGLFLSYYFNAMMKKEFARVVEGANVSNLYFKYLEDIEIQIPSIRKQEKIVSFLVSVDKKIKAVQTQITKTQKFKKGLLQKMFV